MREYAEEGLERQPRFAACAHGAHNLCSSIIRDNTFSCSDNVDECLRKHVTMCIASTYAMESCTQKSLMKLTHA